MITRRRIIQASATATLAAAAGRWPSSGDAWAAGLSLPAGLPQGLRDNAVLETLPGKRPLIKLSYRPPNYEAPIEYFRTAITPNDEFFVRYHLANIPDVDAKTWKVAVGGDGANSSVTLSLDDLRSMPTTEIVAVCQCSGNRRGLFEPHVPGVEWGYGAMGCARWKGVRLKDLLDRVGVKKETIEVAFNGADGPVSDVTPDFIKSIPVAKAIEDTTLIAFEMNGQPLPHFNGFPARMVVPGWTATYWVKHITSIAALTKPQGGFWMNAAYRIPLGKFPIVAQFPTQQTDANTPITEMVVNSLITGPSDGERVPVDKPLTVTGLAWDAGYGITSVEVSSDGGQTWSRATLGEDLGRYAFRSFSFAVTPKSKGRLTVLARATNAIGQTQTAELIQNPAGYHHNVISRITLDVA